MFKVVISRCSGIGSRSSLGMNLYVPSTVICLALAVICSAANSPVEITICSHPIAEIDLWENHFVARFAVEEYLPALLASVINNNYSIQWKYLFLGNGLASPMNLVQAWTINGTARCHALLGPGSSSYAISMSPVIDRLWLDWSSTAITLSDKTNYPYFARVIPTDAIGAQMLVKAIVSVFGWKKANVLFSDTSYGRSFSSGFSDAFVANGGAVTMSRSVSQNPTQAAISDVVDALLLSSSKVLLIAMSPSDAAFALLGDEVRRRKIGSTLLYVFSESFCSQIAENGSAYSATGATMQALLSPFAGAVCARYGSGNSSALQAFSSAFARRNLTTDQTLVHSLTDIPSGFTVPSSVSGLSYLDFALDAAHAAMLALQSLVASGSLTTNPKAISAASIKSLLLATSFSQGSSGFVNFDEKGDRRAADGTLVNLQKNATAHVVIATITNAVNVTPSEHYLTSGVFLLGATYLSTSLPAYEILPSSNEWPISSNILLAILIAAVTVLVVGFFLYKAYTSKRFLKLIRMGLWIVLLQVVMLCAFIVLQVVTVVSISLKSYPVVFLALYSSVSCLSVIVYSVEVTLLVMYFLRNVQASNDLPEDEVIAWEFRFAQVHLVGLGVRDLPVFAMNFAAIMQESEMNYAVLVSTCVSCVLAGMKFMRVKARIARFLFDRPERKFKSLKQVVWRIITLKRFGIDVGEMLKAKGKGTGVHHDGGESPRGRIIPTTTVRPLSSRSTDDEVGLAYRRWKALEPPQRVKQVQHLSVSMAMQLREAVVTSDEFFGIIAPYWQRRFNPKEEEEDSHRRQAFINRMGRSDGEVLSPKGSEMSLSLTSVTFNTSSTAAPPTVASKR